MALPTIRGNIQPQLQRYTGRYSPTSGWAYDQEFRGLDEVQMQQLAYQYANSGCEYELTFQYGIATLRTVDNRGNITIDTWEIVVNEQLTSWLYNPKLQAQLYALAAAYIATPSPKAKPPYPGYTPTPDTLDNTVTTFVSKLAKGIDNKQQPFHPVSAVGTTPPVDTGIGDGVFSIGNFFDGFFAWSNVSSDIYLPIFRAYQQALTGKDSFFDDQFVLRHTTNASNRGYFNVADTNVQKIYTQSQFYNEITNSNYWLFPAPNEIIGALTNIFVGLGTAKANYLNGALKGASDRVTAANNRVNIVTEYKLDNLSTDKYALAS